jgi:protein TonB
MLAYAPTRRRVAERPSSPNAMLFVISAHVVAIAAVMSAKMDLPRRIFDPPPKVISIPMPKDPPPIEIARSLPPQPLTQLAQAPRPENPQPIPLVTSSGPAARPNVNPGPIQVADANVVVPELPPRPSASAAQLLTSGAELKPPYPQSKLLSEEEALLQLRLTIDEHGRVVAVDPVGRADPVFLAAARRYLIAHWRYKPAMSDGRPVSTALTILLRFQLDD